MQRESPDHSERWYRPIEDLLFENQAIRHELFCATVVSSIPKALKITSAEVDIPLLANVFSI
jgi:hypothetical protein